MRLKSNNTKCEQATFAGGCFWCMEPPFDDIAGVINTVVGYTGGHTKNPTYEEVSTGKTGHTEAIQITYDPALVTYEKLLEVFWKNIDPTTSNRQFVDAGTQYRPEIFYHNEEQKRLAEESKSVLNNSGMLAGPIVTPITQLAEFYPGEEYHQEYYKKNPGHYKLYRRGSGRDQFLDNIWRQNNKEKK